MGSGSASAPGRLFISEHLERGNTALCQGVPFVRPEATNEASGVVDLTSVEPGVYQGFGRDSVRQRVERVKVSVDREDRGLDSFDLRAQAVLLRVERLDADVD